MDKFITTTECYDIIKKRIDEIKKVSDNVIDFIKKIYGNLDTFTLNLSKNT